MIKVGFEPTMFPQLFIGVEPNRQLPTLPILVYLIIWCQPQDSNLRMVSPALVSLYRILSSVNYLSINSFKLNWRLIGWRSPLTQDIRWLSSFNLLRELTIFPSQVLNNIQYQVVGQLLYIIRYFYR